MKQLLTNIFASICLQLFLFHYYYRPTYGATEHLGTHYGTSTGNNHIKRLYDDLLVGYNRLIRPVHNNSERLTVLVRLKLSQIIDVDEKNQVMTVNVWVRQEWYDYRLTWQPSEYGGVRRVYVPSEAIWIPDIVLYNNADGHYETTSLTKAALSFDGTIVWEPPAIFRSSCLINVEYFPFDEQQCSLVFGSWTYDGNQVDLIHKCSEREPARYKNRPIEFGSDLRRIAQNGAWDILSVPAMRRERYYPCCTNPVPELTFNITIRRRTLFYTVNLIIPCVGICFLTVLVFYLPSDSGEKVTLCISILLSLTLFFLLLAEIIPPTSLAIPLIGKYILFTMVLVTLSICVTVIVLNFHHRSPVSHEMPEWVRIYFLNYLPKLLGMQRYTHGFIKVAALQQPSSSSTQRQQRRAQRRREEAECRHYSSSDDYQYYLNRQQRHLSSSTTNRVVSNVRQPPPTLMAGNNYDEQRSHYSYSQAPFRPEIMHSDNNYISYNTSNNFTDAAAPSSYSNSAYERAQLLIAQLNFAAAAANDDRENYGIRRQRRRQKRQLGTVSGGDDDNYTYKLSKTTTVPVADGDVGGFVHTAAHAHSRRAHFEHADGYKPLPASASSAAVERSLNGVMYIANHVRKNEEFRNVAEEWKFIAMALDRLFLWLFSLSCTVGSLVILLNSPVLYDSKKPLDVERVYQNMTCYQIA